MLLIALFIAVAAVHGQEEGHFDECNSPIVTGTGKASLPRYGYDAAKGACKLFTYSGSGGNENRYETHEECETETASCPNKAPFDKCNAALVTGRCRASIPRFGYDAATRACRPFSYGGCGGNENSYETHEECETATATCPNKAPFDKCNAPIEAGPCKEPVPRYGYDAVTGTCKPFTYGGCDGNENRYETHEKCEDAIAKCSNKAPFDKCYAAIAGGPCRGAFEKYGYNVVTGACELFTYGGCAGNENKYEMLEDCESATADCTNTAHFDKCNSPIDKGTCNAALARYGYDAAKGVCKLFNYGGCDGNANKYGTHEECETATATCPNKARFDKCNAALVRGYCQATHPRFGYDAAKGACMPFIWGGCGGNANRFETQKECETATASCSDNGAFDLCNAAIEKGTCNERYVRYGYDAVEGACKQFIYTDCDGNGNNFISYRVCEKVTATCPNRAPYDKCKAPIVAGYCEQNLSQYGYDADIGACRQFIYHGCDGNANRFGTYAKCEAATATCSNKSHF